MKRRREVRCRVSLPNSSLFQTNHSKKFLVCGAAVVKTCDHTPPHRHHVHLIRACESKARMRCAGCSCITMHEKKRNNLMDIINFEDRFFVLTGRFHLSAGLPETPLISSWYSTGSCNNKTLGRLFRTRTIIVYYNEYEYEQLFFK